MVATVRVQKAVIESQIASGLVRKLTAGGLFRLVMSAEETLVMTTTSIEVGGWHIEIIEGAEYRLLNGKISKKPIMPRKVNIALAIAEATRDNTKMNIKAGDKVAGLWIID